MIEEQARVVSVDAEQVFIEADRQSACGQCMAQDSCGQKSIAQWAAQKMVDIPVANPLGLSVEPGDLVVVGIEERQFVMASLLLYFVPLLSMMMAAGLATGFNASQGGVILTAVIGLGLGFWLVKLRARDVSAEVNYQPQILRLSR